MFGILYYMILHRHNVSSRQYGPLGPVWVCDYVQYITLIAFCLPLWFQKQAKCEN